jgi:propionate CoA-transferase
MRFTLNIWLSFASLLTGLQFKKGRSPMKEESYNAESPHSHPLLSGLPAARARKGKVVTAEEAVRVIRDGDTIATGGFVGIGFAEELAIELEKYFLSHQKPRDLTLIYAAGQGDGVDRGLNQLGTRAW